jgi:hypothetical protein
VSKALGMHFWLCVQATQVTVARRLPMLAPDEYIVVHASPSCAHCVALVEALAKAWPRWPEAFRLRLLLDLPSGDFLRVVPTIRVFKADSVTPQQEFQGPEDPMALIQQLLFGV